MLFRILIVPNSDYYLCHWLAGLLSLYLCEKSFTRHLVIESRTIRLTRILSRGEDFRHRFIFPHRCCRSMEAPPVQYANHRPTWPTRPSRRKLNLPKSVASPPEQHLLDGTKKARQKIWIIEICDESSATLILLFMPIFHGIKLSKALAIPSFEKERVVYAGQLSFSTPLQLLTDRTVQNMVQLQLQLQLHLQQQQLQEP